MMHTDENNLFNLLIKNLPPKIHASDNKSGAYSKASVNTSYALKHNAFIEFNSKERITIVVFDKDAHEGSTALEYFEDLPTFQEWLSGRIDIVPSYICQTTKGFQFGFVINGFMTIQGGYNPKNSPQQYLYDIKRKFIGHLELDNIASSKNNGIFRNPLLHKYIAYTNIIYNLNDLNNALLDVVVHDEIISYQKSSCTRVSKNEKITSNRNNSIFLLCCREFAYSKPTQTQIYGFANNLNKYNCIEPLPASEIKSITMSIYRRCQDGALKSGSKKASLNREKLKRDRKKQIIKYFLNCKTESKKPIKAEIARNIGISVTALSKTYGDFIHLKYKI